MTTTLDTSERPAPVSPPVNTRRRRKLREAGLGYALLIPALVVFALFIFYPFFKNFDLGMHRTNPFNPDLSEYVGFDQFGDVLGSDEFLDSLWTTVMFALMTVPVGIALGLGLAILAHQKLKGIAIFRTIFSSTVATSVAVASVMFYTLFNPNIGLLKSISPTPPFLENPDWALIAIAVVTIWQNLGLSFILMSAGLQAIPDELVEAAQVDGAGPWSRFRNVTLPLLSPTVFFAVVVGSIFAFQTFGQIDILTEGGPLNKTNVLTYAIFRALRTPPPNPGKAAVLAIALFAITLVLTLIQMRFLERRVHYQR